ncbi:MAG: hypothetical protein NZM11_05610 [Anaerolineales bacterium]|nr:hypothetical protein [Anaerolineales bacterium]
MSGKKTEAHPTKPPRPWAVTLSGLLILAQGVSLFVLSAIGFATLLGLRYWPRLPLPPALARDVSRFQLTLDLNTFVPAVLFGATLGLMLALCLLLNGPRILQRKPQAWIEAMLFQGLGLMLMLSLYLSGRRDGWIFLWMFSSLLIVLQLNRAEVTETFKWRLARRQARAHTPSEAAPNLAEAEPESLR